jgi:hypothetical protein
MRSLAMYEKLQVDCVGSFEWPGNITRDMCEQFINGCKCKRMAEEPRQANVNV